MANDAPTTLNFNYDSMCKTGLKENDKYTFVWMITDFSSRTEGNGEFFDSKNFTIMGPKNEACEFFARLYPYGRNLSSRDYISVSLFNDSNYDINTKYAVSTVDSQNNKMKIVDFKMKKINSKTGFALDKFLERTKMFGLTQLVSNDTLTLVFEITLGEIIDRNVPAQNCFKAQLFQDLSHLYYTKEYSDVRFICRDKKFDCHKIILASRSPVFKDMFESNMKENINGIIVMNDISLEVFESMLKYIYTGEAPKIETYDTFALGLFIAADRFKLVKLKELCEKQLTSQINFENCMNLLALGDKHNASSLKTAAMEFASQNMDKLSRMEWQSTLITYPTLFVEVMEMMFPDENDRRD